MAWTSVDEAIEAADKHTTKTGQEMTVAWVRWKDGATELVITLTSALSRYPVKQIMHQTHKENEDAEEKV
jgi:hypothetical protein